MLTIQTNSAAIPVLKPIVLNQDFINRIKGGSLKSSSIVIIADDDEYVFFVQCIKKWDESLHQNSNIVRLQCDNGIADNGDLATIDVASAIDISVIFKMNYHDLKAKLDYQNYDFNSMPYLGIEDQLLIVNKLSAKLNDTTNLPKLVVLRKSKQE
ncbi:hypothetical protein MCFN_01790 [Mycoplasmopsis californica]|uniref:Uncharacterized protein n=2 Tax=Mycoplasmopsis californica TaxID=2113 RepID=A0A059XLT6_9BACT|nr:hypothetical protein MCFN_01790 [Mycoplasmopsis californica]